MLQTYMILSIPAILFALTIHEYAHGWTALQFGDTTARDEGRLTLNPLAHLDPLGTLMMIGTIFYRFIPFGWARPVPVNPYNFKNPKVGMMLVSLAGPGSNVIAALLFGAILRAFGHFAPNLAISAIHGVAFLKIAISINLGLSFFNLLPIPPLDGSKILMGFLPNRLAAGYIRQSRNMAIVFIVLILLERMARIPTISVVLGPLWSFYEGFWSAIINWKAY